MLVDLRAKKITGKEAETILGDAHITVNKNAIPNDPEKPFVTSGIRLGSPAMTTRGFREEEARQVGNLIADVLDNPLDAINITRVREQVVTLTKRFRLRLMHKDTDVVPQDPLRINPDCGLKTRGWPETEAALHNMVAAARELRNSSF